MIGLEEAQARLLALRHVLPSEVIDVADAAGRVLASALIALRDQPADDQSAMDGYAVSGPGPWRVIGESAAGAPFAGKLNPGEAVRIFTGAFVPDGSDCVVMQEDMERDGAMASLSSGLTVSQGRHIRRKSGDFAQGVEIIPAGTRLSAVHVGLAIAAGHARLPVVRPVRVAILSTGNELDMPGQPLAQGQIPASNGPMLAAMLVSPLAKVKDKGIVPDDLEATMAAISGAEADVIITIGGASVGDHDLVRPALLKLGADIDFWKVAMKPGKPLMAGRLGDAIVLGLPGNPVSAYVTAMLFAQPLIAAMAGEKEPPPPYRQLPLGEDLPANGARTDHLRATLRDGRVHPVGLNDSAALLALASATHLIRRSAHAPAASAGESVDVLDLT